MISTIMLALLVGGSTAAAAAASTAGTSSIGESSRNTPMNEQVLPRCADESK